MLGECQDGESSENTTHKHNEARLDSLTGKPAGL